MPDNMSLQRQKAPEVRIVGIISVVTKDERIPIRHAVAARPPRTRGNAGGVPCQGLAVEIEFEIRYREIVGRRIREIRFLDRAPVSLDDAVHE